MTLAQALSAYALPLAAASFAGALIGLERELRGHPAGLRTHTMVSLTSAMLMVAASHQMTWLGTDVPRAIVRVDPVHMAHGILTGIGFLCGGVIFRQGLNVRGLTTAASLWAVSGLGILFGVGAYGLGLGASLATLGILAILRMVDRRLPNSSIFDVSVCYRREGDQPEPLFRRRLTELHLHPQIVRHALKAGGREMEIGAVLRGPSGVQISELARRLASDETVTTFEIGQRED